METLPASEMATCKENNETDTSPELDRDSQQIIPMEKYQFLMKWVPRVETRFQLKAMRELLNPEVPESTIQSIYSQAVVKKTKETLPLHSSKRKKYYETFCERKKAGEHHVVGKMAGEAGITPCTMIRLLLDQHLCDLPKPPKFFEPDTSQNEMIADIFEWPTMCDWPELAAEIEQADLEDMVFGPTGDMCKRFAGQVYELKTKQWCDRMGLPYKTEEQMRAEGYDKTPDIYLQVPAALKKGGFVFNWIECKAVFGGPENHREYIDSQLVPYTIRYGPGLVIYWFGFIEEYDFRGLRSAGIKLLDRLPEESEITKLDAKKLAELDWKKINPKLAVKSKEKSSSSKRS